MLERYLSDGMLVRALTTTFHSTEEFILVARLGGHFPTAMLVNPKANATDTAASTKNSD